VVERRRSTLRTAVVWDALQAALEARSRDVGGRPLDVVDLGGGTGGLAVRIAGLGHRVTVVDLSPDALASLERRAAEADVTVSAVQGDADSLVQIVGEQNLDAVVCHELLEVVDKPERAAEQVASALRPGGLASVLVAQRSGAVLARALATHLAQARELLDHPEGIAAADSILRRFGRAEIESLLAGAGLRVEQVRGVRVFADHISSAVVDADPAAADALQALEAAVADRPEFVAVALQLHVLARR
jgi:2-polyprenyl-3-methyl-5-hydroxy-6-metoxy-1,4-benzoquinol methylase